MTVLSPRLFCNPVQKTIPPALPFGVPTVTPITNPITHLVCYNTTQGPSFQGTLIINNQFGPGRTSAGPSDILCVPSLKLRWSVVPAPTSLNPPGDVQGNQP